MHPQELRRQLKQRLQEAFGDRLKGVILYGSEARGEAGEDSDVDVMALLEGPIRLWEDIGLGVEATYDLTLALGRPVHVQPTDAAEFEKGDFAIYRNAKAEGVAL